MTDAERIAEYLIRCGLSDNNWPDCARILRYDGADFTDKSCYGVVKHLAAMLSDVRREEREAIRALIAEERASLPPRSNAREQVLHSIDTQIMARSAK